MVNKFKNIIILFCAFLLVSCDKIDYEYKSDSLQNKIYILSEDMYAKGVAHNIIVPNDTEQNTVSNIGADAYIIASIEAEKSSIAKFHNPFKKLPMASVTKIMTMLITLKNCNNLDDYYEVSANAVDLEKDVSSAKLRAGDSVKVRDLLYRLMVTSGNDAAMVLAENVFHSYDNFIIEMNNEAERLGALNTHFNNPHGLDSDHHFTTVYDLFLIMRELIKFPIFREISTIKEYVGNIKSADGTIRNEKWENTNYFITEELPLSGIVTLEGGKTGNTKNAGVCLALLTKHKKTGIEYISVVLNATSKRNVYYNTNALINEIDK